MAMKRSVLYWLLVYGTVIVCFCGICIIGGRAVTTINTQTVKNNRKCIVIDAGHGGVDGGTTSCTGVTESNLNLEIALRLNDLLHLLGIDTKMIRTTDCSVYTSGKTIAAKKVSDLKERVRIVETTENCILISIHQNFFGQSIYSGAQVFYGAHIDGLKLARDLQSNFIASVNPGSKRTSKKASGVYLMEHVSCPAVLIECGFLSNPEEEAKLRNEAYQKKICAVIASTVSITINQ